MKAIIDELKLFVHEKGYTQDDKRLNRKVKAFPGHIYAMGSEMFDVLKKEKPIDKYTDDWKRMYPTFRLAVKTALEDKDSRRLVVLNDSRYSKVFQCFTHLHFMMTGRGDYDMYVYLRSSDLDKFKDDCVFFASIAKKFENQVKIPVTKLVIMFGSLHYTLDPELATSPAELSKASEVPPAPSNESFQDGEIKD